jgi:hypothetical protein
MRIERSGGKRMGFRDELEFGAVGGRGYSPPAFLLLQAHVI